MSDYPQGQIAIEANSSSTVHPDYAVLAGRVLADQIHRATVKSFSDWVHAYSDGESVRPVKSSPPSHLYLGPRAILRRKFVDDVAAHADELDEAVIHARDYGFYL